MSRRPRIRLIHWRPAEAGLMATRLRGAGYELDLSPFDAKGLKAIRKDPPAAVVIDLSRLPAQGRDVGLALRASNATRHVPLVFVDGDPNKVERVRRSLPDAVYTAGGRIRGSVKRAIARPPSQPIVPASALAGYSGTALPKKLGIKSGCVVALVGAPADFDRTLGSLPPEVTLRRQARGRRDLTLWFVRSRRDLAARMGKLAAAVEADALWILWPKKASGIVTDLDQQTVRRSGLAHGLVDYKICAVDATWSGLCFARRKRR